jgi:predicted mannosyl-3-phosphoglycerate phosphatase (HAD superfamily)
MEAHIAENGLRQTSSILYIAVDGLIPARGSSISGLDEFTAALDHAGIPAVWLTSRTRLQLDEPRRKMAHTHPFIAEDGCGVFLPEDYFHLLPQTSPSQPRKSPTVRLGRFTCLPVAEQQPAASEALEALSEETGVSVVPLRSLAPRELAQNTGLPQREAELARQRDFDELFFFAGASDEDIENFQAVGRTRNYQLRPQSALWSLAIGASVRRCISELSKLYDRALHSHAKSVGIAVTGSELELFPACDRAVLLTNKSVQAAEPSGHHAHRVLRVPLNSPDKWKQILASLTTRP